MTTKKITENKQETEINVNELDKYIIKYDANLKEFSETFKNALQKFFPLLTIESKIIGLNEIKSSNKNYENVLGAIQVLRQTGGIDRIEDIALRYGLSGGNVDEKIDICLGDKYVCLESITEALGEKAASVLIKEIEHYLVKKS